MDFGSAMRVTPTAQQRLRWWQVRGGASHGKNYGRGLCILTRLTSSSMIQFPNRVMLFTELSKVELAAHPVLG